MQTFVTQKEQLNSRFDTHYYQPKYMQFEKQIKSHRSGYTYLDQVSKVVCGPFGSAIKVTDYLSKGVPLLRITNINESGGFDKTNFKYIPDDLASQLQNYKVNEDDIVVSQRGTLGQIAQIDKSLNGSVISANLIAIKNIKKESFLPIFIKVYLTSTLSQIQLERKVSGQVQIKITTDDIKTILIPNLSLKTQQEIVSITQSAYKKKQKMEQEAEELLNEVETNILQDLGIKKLEIKKKLTFIIEYKQIKKGRIDPITFINMQDTELSSIYKEKSLGDIVIISKGKSISQKDIISGKYPVIAGGQTSPYKINKYNYKGDVITVSASGAYSGYVWYHNDPIFASDCLVLRSKNESMTITKFIYAVMKAKQKYIYNMQQGAGQPHVYAEDLRKLRVTLPTYDIQKAIIAKMEYKVERAKTLKKEAILIIKQAKQQVENIILGK